MNKKILIALLLVSPSFMHGKGLKAYKKAVLLKQYKNIKNNKKRAINRPQNQASSVEASNKMGKSILSLTNQFRAKNKLSELSWNQALSNLARAHCAAMAEGKVSFGHDGFSDRVAQFPYSYRSAAENVAYFYGTAQNQLPTACTNGWINSPGHRKNLVGDFTHCGIATYKNSKGVWYFTQLFAKF